MILPVLVFYVNRIPLLDIFSGFCSFHTMVFVKFIQVAASAVCFLALLDTTYKYLTCGTGFVSCEWMFCSFQFFIITGKTAIHISVLCWFACAWVSLGFKYTQEQCNWIKEYASSALLDNAKLFSNVVVSMYTSVNSFCWQFLLPTFSPTSGWLSLKMFASWSVRNCISL